MFTSMLVKRQIGMQQATNKLWQAANTDALTGLSNRHSLHEAVNEIVADQRSKHERFALLLLDLDNFKLINDTLGHEAGDVVLRTAARRIRRMSRGAYFVARLGGDEFAILYKSFEQVEIVEASRRILHELRRRMNYRGQCVELCTSIGVAYFPNHAATWNDIFRAADLALYRAKQAGRNRFVVFDPTMLAEAEKRFAVLESVRLAISQDHIVPFYQPKVAIATGEVVGFEALARIVRRDGHIDIPKNFISALEDPDVGRAFGLKFVECVARDMQAWSKAGLDITGVAVNVSTTELRAEDYAERIFSMLQAYQIPTEHFEIEVTETAAIDDAIASIGRNLRALAGRGISISLDDFGTGFASLTHLKSLPIAQVKIDQSFVRNILTDTESRSIVSAIVSLSHSLGKSVVAEGVEDEDQLAAVGELGCDIAQGFLFAEPICFDDVAPFVLRSAVRTLTRIVAPTRANGGRNARQTDCREGPVPFENGINAAG